MCRRTCRRHRARQSAAANAAAVQKAGLAESRVKQIAAMSVIVTQDRPHNPSHLGFVEKLRVLRSYGLHLHCHLLGTQMLQREHVWLEERKTRSRSRSHAHNGTHLRANLRSLEDQETNSVGG